MTTAGDTVDDAPDGTFDAAKVVDGLRSTFRGGRTRDLAWRTTQLQGIECMLAEREREFAEVLAADLGRPPVDAWLADLAPSTAESAYARKRLKRWARPRRVGLPLAVQPGRARYEYGLLDGCGGTVVTGGGFDPGARTGEPTVLVDPDPSSPLMREEIFGPILPVVTVESIDAAVAHVNAGPKPLATDAFTRSKGTADRVIRDVSCGATVVNHLMFHVLVPQLPFGGVGRSGMGAYHGRWGFETFSHRRSVLVKSARPDPRFVYPPYGRAAEKLLRKLF